MRVPRVIHFVWAGGVKPMPDENLAAILSWHQSNPDFEIYFWIDKKTADRDLSAHYLDTLRTVATQKGIPFNPDKFKFKDITEEAVANPIIRYEIDRLTPNYGSSSDLIRYHALYKYGGAYFDSDIEAGERALRATTIFDEDNPNHRLYVDPNAQDAGAVGNDVFICTPGCPLMGHILSLAESHYHATTSIGRYEPTHDIEMHSTFAERFGPVQHVYMANGAEFIESSTVARTGPGCVRCITDPFMPENTKIPADNNPLRFIDDSLRKPRRDLGLAWLKQPVRPQTLPNALTKTVSAIKFEAEMMGFLRLEDHLDYLVMGTGVAKTQALHELTNALRHTQIDFGRVAATQLTGRYPELSNTYAALGISPEKFHHYPRFLKSMDVGDQYACVFTARVVPPEIQKLLQICREEHHKFSELAPGEKALLSHHLAQVSQFLPQLVAHLDQQSSTLQSQTSPSNAQRALASAINTIRGIHGTFLGDLKHIELPEDVLVPLKQAQQRFDEQYQNVRNLHKSTAQTTTPTPPSSRVKL